MYSIIFLSDKHPIDCKAFLGLCSLVGQVPFAEREAPKSLKEGCFEKSQWYRIVLRKRVVSLEAKWEYHSLPFQQLSIAFPIFPILFCSIFRVCVTLPDRIEDFDIKNTESQCCITGHRDPVSETPVMCDREILLQCITGWFGSVEPPGSTSLANQSGRSQGGVPVWCDSCFRILP